MADFGEFQKDVGAAPVQAAPQQVIQTPVDTTFSSVAGAATNFASGAYNIFAQESNRQAQAEQAAIVNDHTRNMAGFAEGADQGVYGRSEAKSLARSETIRMIAQDPANVEAYKKSYKLLFESGDGDLAAPTKQEEYVDSISKDAMDKGFSVYDSNGDVNNAAVAAYTANQIQISTAQAALTQLKQKNETDTLRLNQQVGAITSASLDGLGRLAKDTRARYNSDEESYQDVKDKMDSFNQQVLVSNAGMGDKELSALRSSLDTQSAMILGQLSGKNDQESTERMSANNVAFQTQKMLKLDPTTAFLSEKFPNSPITNNRLSAYLVEVTKKNAEVYDGVTDFEGSKELVTNIHNVTKPYSDPSAFVTEQGQKLVPNILQDSIDDNLPEQGLNTASGIVSAAISGIQNDSPEHYKKYMKISASQEFTDYVSLNKEKLDPRKAELAQNELAATMQAKVLPAYKAALESKIKVYVDGVSVGAPISSFAKLQKVGGTYKFVVNNEVLNRAVEGNTTIPNEDRTVLRFTPFKASTVLQKVRDLNQGLGAQLNSYLRTQANLFTIMQSENVSPTEVVENNLLPELALIFSTFGEVAPIENKQPPTGDQVAAAEKQARGQPNITGEQVLKYQGLPPTSGERNLAPVERDTSVEEVDIPEDTSTVPLIDKTKPINSYELEVGNNFFLGQDAIEAVEAKEGRSLSLPEKRVVELEGFTTVPYTDTKGVVTSGVGQTGEFRGKSFRESFKVHEAKTKKLVPNLDNFSEELKAELIQATYRGDLGISKKARSLINEGKYKEAAKEFLDNDDYREAVASGSGIADRMEAVANALRNEK